MRSLQLDKCYSDSKVQQPVFKSLVPKSTSTISSLFKKSDILYFPTLTHLTLVDIDLRDGPNGTNSLPHFINLSVLPFITSFTCVQSGAEPSGQPILILPQEVLEKLTELAIFTHAPNASEFNNIRINLVQMKNLKSLTIPDVGFLVRPLIEPPFAISRLQVCKQWHWSAEDWTRLEKWLNRWRYQHEIDTLVYFKRSNEEEWEMLWELQKHLEYAPPYQGIDLKFVEEIEVGSNDWRALLDRFEELGKIFSFSISSGSLSN